MDETSLQIIIWIGGILFAIIGVLISALSIICWNAVKDLRQKYNESLKENSERAKNIYDRIEAERKERQEKHDKAIERVSVRIEELQRVTLSSISQVKEDMGDVRETVAGFGSVYVTRKEWGEGCPRKSRHPNGGG
jgi:ABC-type bacteriocin/lantibiotic exporter with double-glycine peptidase domain